MNWLDVTVGAVAGLVLQNLAYPSAQAGYLKWRSRRRFRAAEGAGLAMEQRFGSLVIVQAGWGEDGTFAHDAVTLELGDEFEVENPGVARILDGRAAQWRADGFDDGLQVGIATLRINRISDRPEDERVGRSHRVVCRMHTYRYFSFLGTHRLLLAGTAPEREFLRELAGEPDCRETIRGFPNPFSVGLSVFCEDGDYLALTRRTASAAAGGHWQGGKIYNAVGENAAPRDFSPGLDGTVRSTPYLIAQRGLWEEVGLPDVDIDASTIKLHSLAYALDLRDHKMFGFAVTHLSRDELRYAWRHAPDRIESAGSDVEFHSVRTRADTRRLLRRIVDEAEQWAPEAVFCTVRSMLVRDLLSASEVRKILAVARLD